jgi:hypothetical protein
MSSIGIGDWMRLRCGDLVSAIDDPRHVGRVEAIFNGSSVKLRWQETGWISYLALDEIERFRKGQ